MTFRLDRTLVERPDILFWSFLVVHVIAWTTVPAIVQANLSLDIIEGLAWGREGQWSYYKINSQQ